MQKTRYLILGAGPSGLAVSRRLLDLGASPSDIVVLERQAEVGGLCRSDYEFGAFDIGGGHFLDVRRPEVLEFIFRFLPQREWQLFERKSTIRLGRIEVDYPLEANIHQLPIEKQIKYLLDVSSSGSSRGLPCPDEFTEYLEWKFGKSITLEYLLPYNKKLWGNSLSSMGTRWLDKLPNVSFEETLRSCLTKRPHGTMPAHSSFYYPKRFGYGEVWRRIGDSMRNQVHTSYEIAAIDFDKKLVDDISYDILISTVPWPTLAPFIDNSSVKSAIANLQAIPINVSLFQEDEPSTSHWIYEPNSDLVHHRILNRRNFSAERGFWVESNALRGVPAGCIVNFGHEFAYPVATISRSDEIHVIHDWARSKGVQPLGRWGSWEHINSDVAVERALHLAEELVAAPNF